MNTPGAPPVKTIARTASSAARASITRSSSSTWAMFM
jgi:hypothetical protein